MGLPAAADLFAPAAVHSRTSSGPVPPVDPFAGSVMAPTASAPALLAQAAPAAVPPAVPRPAAVPACGGMVPSQPAPPAQRPQMTNDDILGLFNKPDSSSAFSSLAPPPPPPMAHRHSASMPAMPAHPPPAMPRPAAAAHQGHLSAQQQFALGAGASQELFSEFCGAKPAGQQAPMATAVGQPAASNWTAQWH